MLEFCGYKNLEDIYSFLGNEITHNDWDIGERLKYDNLAAHMVEISKKNNICLSFLGNGLPDLSLSPLPSYLCTLRKLSTAYTPYQPELGQGTLIGLQIYTSMLQKLTGMEVVNASLYDRSSAIFEATQTAVRLHKGKKNTALILGSVYPNDLAVTQTYARHTPTKIEVIALDQKLGKISTKEVREWLEKNQQDCACIIIPQVNHLGVIEDFDDLTDLGLEFGVTPVAVIDPFHLFPGPNSLKKPRFWGKEGRGVPMMVGEGQHLAIGPNFGGLGLGIFAAQYNDADRQTIRSIPGRLVGRTKDVDGRECFTLIMSTREQHIRREKATSNICSNQSFLALMAGAALLEKGYLGLAKTLHTAMDWASAFKSTAVELVYPQAKVINEVLIRTKKKAKELIEEARVKKIHLGVAKGEHEILISFSDKHTQEQMDQLCQFLSLSNVKKNHREDYGHDATWPQYSFEALKEYYNKLDGLNLSPDDAIYPLGSCTMKYNPVINEYAASLPGFTQIHPDAPIEDAQGSLQILFEIQELFKQITGLPYVTGMPVAGAQGELVGLKVFQRYFEHHEKDKNKRKYLLIPRSAHGTNPATAAVANLANNLIIIEADSHGRMDFEQLKKVVAQYGEEIFGIMVTNPNTSGIFESSFKDMAELIHGVGGLVYMDGANMNAIAGWANLKNLGVDAVHNNLHKTWSIPPKFNHSA